jgi:hypothetical protein
MDRIGCSLLSGVTGALTATLLNESARQLIPHAPRMDVIGQRALARVMEGAGMDPPRGDRMYAASMVGDIVTNSLYYSAVGIGPERSAVRRGAILGLVAGLGAATLPEPLGLGPQPGQKTPITQLLTISWYTIGGIAAGAAFRAIAPSPRARNLSTSRPRELSFS